MLTMCATQLCYGSATVVLFIHLLHGNSLVFPNATSDDPWLGQEMVRYTKNTGIFENVDEECTNVTPAVCCDSSWCVWMVDQ